MYEDTRDDQTQRDQALKEGYQGCPKASHKLLSQAEREADDEQTEDDEIRRLHPSVGH